MKKNIILFIVFLTVIFAFSFETKAFAKALNLEQPVADSCYEITLKSGQKIYTNILEIDTNVIKFRICGALTDSFLTIEKSQIADIKGITLKDYRKRMYDESVVKSERRKDINIAKGFYIASLLPYLIMLLYPTEQIILGCLLVSILLSLLAILSINGIKGRFKNRLLLKILSAIQIIIPLIIVGLGLIVEFLIF